MLSFLFEMLCGYLMADFLVGIYHWFKDSYFTPHTDIIGKTFIWGSRLHHARPMHVTEFSDWDLFRTSGIWTLIWYLPYVVLFGLSPFNVMLFMWIAMNDVVHKYTHVAAAALPSWVNILQKAHVFQGHDEHHQHHIAPHMINYCPITPYVNNVLEPINFWRQLEAFVEKTFGLKPRQVLDEYVDDPKFPGGIRFLTEGETPSTPRSFYNSD